MSISILTILALIPPLILMIYVYKNDKVEREPIGLVLKTCLFGAISVIPALILELILGGLFGLVLPEGSLIYLIIDNFIGVALIEEFVKMIACRVSVWNNENFNYTFDGVVYCVASAIGFAALENVSYIFTYPDLSTVILRAVTSIPAHTIFGIFMGVHLGIAKYDELHGYENQLTHHTRMALLIPILLHGSYDFMCSIESTLVNLLFLVFVIVLDVVAIRTLKKYQREDTEIY